MALIKSCLAGSSGVLETGSFQTANGQKHISFQSPHTGDIVLGVHINSTTFSFTNACSVFVGSTEYDIGYTPTASLKIDNVTSEGFDVTWDNAVDGSYFVK